MKKFLLLALVMFLIPACGSSDMNARPTLTPIPASPTSLLPTQTLTPSLTPTSTPITPTPRPADLSKFEPPDGKVLVFIGQDNASVGGNGPYHDGYVDHIGVPAGVTTYVYMTDHWTNGLGYDFGGVPINGLLAEEDWGWGPSCAECYLSSPEFSHSIIHLSISLEGLSEYFIADGRYDYMIDELSRFLKAHSDHPFFLRIGYEFDGPWNNYEPTKYKLAFRRIVDKLRADGVNNFATVLAGSSINVEPYFWHAYYPGDEYVDWIGFSYWGWGPITGTGTLDFARKHGKPVMIAESSPLHASFPTADGDKVWNTWFVPYIQRLRDNQDLIKAIAYINCDWQAEPMWVGDDWEDTRIQTNETIERDWMSAMQDPMFINGDDDVFGLIGFTP